MKKVLSFLLMFTLLIPTLMFAGCTEDNDAKSIVNNIYYVTKVLRKGEDISKEYTDNNMRIAFHIDHFEVEVSTNKDANKYGYYLGTYDIDENEIELEVTEAGGAYKNYKENPEKEVSVFKSFRYDDGKLYTEFAHNGSIYSFTLEKKAN